MSRRVIVVGAGMGGLAAALRLARHGFRVHVLEARAGAGGLASGFEAEGLSFDAGPYVLLDRPGLEWALAQLGVRADELALLPIDPVYEVAADGAPTVRICASREETAAGLERDFPGAGARYLRFVERAWRAHRRLRPALFVSRPRPWTLLRDGGWRAVPWALRSLGGLLGRAGLPDAVIEALGIWTHVAGQRLAEAPGPMAFVPAIIHHVGAFFPKGGLAAVPRLVEQAALDAGVEIERGVRVRAIRQAGGRATGVETFCGQALPADAVVSNHGGVGTYLDLVRDIPARAAARLAALPLQSPGVCAYLAVRGPLAPPYLRFRRVAGEPCRLLVLPGVCDPALARGGWWPARLVAPMLYDEAQRGGAGGQRAWLERVLGESWWREGLGEVRVVATRVPAEWGAQFHLYRDSMNPVMTARFMRAGRLAHRSPHLRGLYLAGSSTHPGQWVSFCAISGVLAADALAADLS